MKLHLLVMLIMLVMPIALLLVCAVPPLQAESIVHADGGGVAHPAGPDRADGGTIHLESRPSGGTVARVSLPGAWRAQPLRPLRPLRRSGCVLVCDDDAVCRILLAEALAGLGYSVVEAEDGLTGLQRWRAGGVRWLITDLTMDGSSGGGSRYALRRCVRLCTDANTAAPQHEATGDISCKPDAATESLPSLFAL